MNTNYIKRKAIQLTIAHLFEGTMEYTPNRLNRFDEPIEPDINALNYFRESLCDLAQMIFMVNPSQFESKLDALYKYSEKIARENLHLWSNNTRTGIWGGRLSYLDDIYTLLALPDNKELLSIGSNFTIYDLDCKITNYRVSELGLWVNLQPIKDGVNSFQIDFNYRELSNINHVIYTKNEDN